MKKKKNPSTDGAGVTNQAFVLHQAAEGWGVEDEGTRVLVEGIGRGVVAFVGTCMFAMDAM